MFPWVIIHNIKPNHVDYYHIEGFWDCSMYVRNKYGVKIHTWVETPCRKCRSKVGNSLRKSFQNVLYLNVISVFLFFFL